MEREKKKKISNHKKFGISLILSKDIKKSGLNYSLNNYLSAKEYENKEIFYAISVLRNFSEIVSVSSLQPSDIYFFLKLKLDFLNLILIDSKIGDSVLKSLEKHSNENFNFFSIIFDLGDDNNDYSDHKKQVYWKSKGAGGYISSLSSLNCIQNILDVFPLSNIDDNDCESENVLKNSDFTLKQSNVCGILNYSETDSWIGINNNDLKHIFNDHIIKGFFNNMFTGRLYRSAFLPMIKNKDDLSIKILNISPEREYYIQKLIGSWKFDPSSLSIEELIFAVYLMLQHGQLNVDDSLKLSEKKLLNFSLSISMYYNDNNPYHNFRHAVDVMQSTFYFLLCSKRLVNYKFFTNFLDSTSINQSESVKKSCEEPFIAASFMEPVHCLALLIASIGHDTGHPGLTNKFLISVNSKISQIYNEKSVLESFHASSFIYFLSQFWPNILSYPTLKSLIIKSIYATDMEMHFDYVKEFTGENTHILQMAKLYNKETDKFSAMSLPVYSKLRNLLASIIIKCSDISNVARPLLISKYWGIAYGKEFENVMTLEKDNFFFSKNTSLISKDKQEKLSINQSSDLNSTLNLSPSKTTENDLSTSLNSEILLGKSQILFINTFAHSIFASLCWVFPELSFTFSTVETNLSYWKSIVDSNSSS